MIAGPAWERARRSRQAYFPSEHHDSTRQDFAFELRGPGSGSWRVRCVASSDQRTETHVVGAHVGTSGNDFDREETPISAESSYACQLDGPDAERWTLQADERLQEGTVLGPTGQTVVAIQGSHERWTWQHQALEGNLVFDGKGGDVVAMVQRSFDGAVALSRGLDPKRQTAVAAICTALLIPGL